MKLKLKDKLYSYVTFKGIFEYVVIGIREYEDNIQYVVECQNCSHGYKCQVLISPRRNCKQFLYIETLNDDGENGDSQDYFHSENDFYKTKYDAYKQKAKKSIEFYEKAIEQSKKSIKNSEKIIHEIEQQLEILKEK